MAKKPILTDDPMDGGDAAPVGATRPVTAPMPSEPTRPAQAPAFGRDASGHARPKTRILGYGAPATSDATQTDAPAVGWLVVIAGPGRGTSLALMSGMNGIGRGDDLQVQLDFGDDAISRDAHAYVTYDDAARRFFVSHGGKTNLVRLNDAAVLATEGLSHGDTLRIGATSLRFVALCGPDFDWSDP
ncbi:FHA domain-containing protein [Rhodobacteraceae bacterium N5(2021)]|uniref:FHA domain-containing protein n=1 Tax=Gymnodinialimonas phycosphaerae TaxID=2841589 RepID=A0A975TWY7_9RHOB|nr:FHA domain-containing protein [Gymnodinialimonas phycosphaerae]MBY4891427.1 FHA domain-containing protein [Gymnodinialimonas phycosphaerae]